MVSCVVRDGIGSRGRDKEKLSTVHVWARLCQEASEQVGVFPQLTAELILDQAASYRRESGVHERQHCESEVGEEECQEVSFGCCESVYVEG